VQLRKVVDASSRPRSSGKGVEEFKEFEEFELMGSWEERIL
jgi:hypothetical protein